MSTKLKFDLRPEPIASATAAGLRYVTDTRPGIRRKRAGKGFVYRDVDGRPIRDPDVRKRIAALAIPPAWTDVWIAREPNGHLQATGRDARGRKQYRYHHLWRTVRDEAKYGRMMAFGQILPTLRKRVEADLSRPGLPKEKVLATVVRLLETTLIRVGNEEYARTNHSFGLTTLRDDHVSVTAAAVRFGFRGKSGIQHTIALSDRRLARVVKRCRELPGQELFQYLGEDGEQETINSEDVNAYLRAITGARLHSQGLSHLGRYGPRGPGASGVRGFRHPDPGQEERRACDRSRRRAPGEHTDRLPQVLCAP